MTHKDLLAKRLKLHEAYQAVFSTPDGQIVLNHILEKGHVYECTFVRGDINETMLREGERRLALSILRFFARDHGDIQKIVQQISEDNGS